MTINVQTQILCHLKGLNVNWGKALTLTFPRNIKSTHEAEKIFGTFVHYLNERLVGKQYRTTGKPSLKLFASLEGARSGKKLHYHVALEQPSNKDDAYIKRVVKKCWAKANRCKISILHIQDYNDSGWLEYICKEINNNNTDAISQHCCW